MPEVRHLIPDNDMIVWSEQQPDFCRKPLGELLPALPFTTACMLMLGAGSLPIVVAPRRLLNAIWNHLAEQPVEMGGLLLGRVHKFDESDSRFVVSLDDHARGEEFDGTGVSLRLDSAVWETARVKAGSGRSVIGWYHSHPNLGPFFSGTDRRTQAAFFGHPHCLGLVVDPVRREEKWFIGENSDQLEPSQVLRFG